MEEQILEIITYKCGNLLEHYKGCRCAIDAILHLIKEREGSYVKKIEDRKRQMRLGVMNGKRTVPTPLEAYDDAISAIKEEDHAHELRPGYSLLPERRRVKSEHENRNKEEDK